MDRIKFFSVYDLSCVSNLIKIEPFLNNLEFKSGQLEVNDLLEIYNVKKYLDNKVYLTEWTAEIIGNFNMIIKQNYVWIAKFYNTINDLNLLDIFKEVDSWYTCDFWDLFEIFKSYNTITADCFGTLLNQEKALMYEVLSYKDIVNFFGAVIRNKLVNETSSAKLLLDKYELKRFREENPTYFPRELSSADKESIICRYIESVDPNPNYLRLISNIQSNKDKLELSPKTILMAKRRAEEIEKGIFTESSGIRMEISVIFSGNQNEVIYLEYEGASIKATYSTKWLEENNDYPTLLNNFIYLFEYVDMHMRCLLVSRIREMGVLERHVLSTSKNAYSKGIAFDQKNILSLLQMTGYYNQLFSNGIRLEEVIEWFFEEYLHIEFNASNFKIRMPSPNSTYLEKCTNIMPAMESVLKQFTLFVKEGEIDFELLQIRSEHLIYRTIPSLVSKKYAYGTGEEFRIATFLLFSDQSRLGYYEKKQKSYENFYELLNSERVLLQDIPDYCNSDIKWLEEHKYIQIDNVGVITYPNIHLINILYDLYHNDVIVYWKYSMIGRKLIDDLERKNIIEFESSLFSRPEEDYLNFFLNKSQFNNGLDLRNIYSHTQPNAGHDDQEHYQNYLIFMRLFIISIIKINDDFATYKNQEDSVG